MELKLFNGMFVFFDGSRYEEGARSAGVRCLCLQLMLFAGQIDCVDGLFQCNLGNLLPWLGNSTVENNN